MSKQNDEELINIDYIEKNCSFIKEIDRIRNNHEFPANITNKDMINDLIYYCKLGLVELSIVVWYNKDGSFDKQLRLNIYDYVQSEFRFSPIVREREIAFLMEDPMYEAVIQELIKNRIEFDVCFWDEATIEKEEEEDENEIY